MTSDLVFEPALMGSLERPGLVMRALDAFGLVRLVTRPSGAANDLNAIGAPIAPMGGYVAHGATCSLSVAPGEWYFITADRAEASALQASVQTNLAGRTALVLDASHAVAILQISGADCRAVLNTYCPLDFSTDAFGPMRAAASLLGDAHALFWRDDGEDTIHIMVDRSRAAYVWEILALAGAP